MLNPVRMQQDINLNLLLVLFELKKETITIKILDVEPKVFILRIRNKNEFSTRKYFYFLCRKSLALLSFNI